MYIIYMVTQLMFEIFNWGWKLYLNNMLSRQKINQYENKKDAERRKQ